MQFQKLGKNETDIKFNYLLVLQMMTKQILLNCCKCH